MPTLLVQVHPYIIKVREVFLTKPYLAIAMDYAVKGDMYGYMEGKYVLRSLTKLGLRRLFFNV